MALVWVEWQNLSSVLESLGRISQSLASEARQKDPPSVSVFYFHINLRF